MIKQNQRILNFCFVLIDAFIVCLSLLCSWLLRFKTTIFGPIGGHLSFAEYVIFMILAVIPTYLILYFSFGLYKPFRTHKTIFTESTQIIKVNIVAFFVLVTILFIINQPNFKELWNIRKEHTLICKDCEFRRLCVDNRIPHKINNRWTHSTECEYNPYISKWNFEEGYLSLKDSGVELVNGELLIDKEKLDLINNRLWFENA